VKVAASAAPAGLVSAVMTFEARAFKGRARPLVATPAFASGHCRRSGKRAILGPLVKLAMCDPRIARSAFFRINAAVAWRSRLPFGEPKGLTNGLTR
jgi:hypothetical protein